MWDTTAEELLKEIHRQVLEAYGGLHGIREPGLLDRAVEQPKATYFYGGQDIFEAAASYLFHLAEQGQEYPGYTGTLPSLSARVMFIRPHISHFFCCNAV